MSPSNCQDELQLSIEPEQTRIQKLHLLLGNITPTSRSRLARQLLRKLPLQMQQPETFACFLQIADALRVTKHREIKSLSRKLAIFATEHPNLEEWKVLARLVRGDFERKGALPIERVMQLAALSLYLLRDRAAVESKVLRAIKREYQQRRALVNTPETALLATATDLGDMARERARQILIRNANNASNLTSEQLLDILTGEELSTLRRRVALAVISNSSLRNLAITWQRWTQVAGEIEQALQTAKAAGRSPAWIQHFGDQLVETSGRLSPDSAVATILDETIFTCINYRPACSKSFPWVDDPSSATLVPVQRTQIRRFHNDVKRLLSVRYGGNRAAEPQNLLELGSALQSLRRQSQTDELSWSRFYNSFHRLLKNPETNPYAATILDKITTEISRPDTELELNAGALINVAELLDYSSGTDLIHFVENPALLFDISARVPPCHQPLDLRRVYAEFPGIRLFQAMVAILSFPRHGKANDWRIFATAAMDLHPSSDFQVFPQITQRFLSREIEAPDVNWYFSEKERVKDLMRGDDQDFFDLQLPRLDHQPLAIIREVQRRCSLIIDRCDPTSSASSLKVALGKGFLEERRALERRVRSAMLLRLIREGTPSRSVTQYFSDSYRVDPLPFVDGKPEQQAMMDEVMVIYRRSADLHLGFESLAIDAARAPGAKRSALAQFGLDVAQDTRLLRCDNPGVFPGPGVMMTGLQRSKIFVAEDPDSREMYGLYRRAWPWAWEEFQTLDQAEFYLLRGLLAVTLPKSAKYKLNGTHYSFVVFNEHFHNFEKHSSFLIPTELFREVLRSASQTLIGEQKSPPWDLGKLPTTLEAFQKRSGASDPILNLGWASNLGGLCNAYPPASWPYHLWEVGLAAHTTDGDGHVHKSHLRGKYESTLSPELELDMIPLRRAHAEVFKVANSYLNHFDLFRYALGLWHKDQTGTDADPRNTEVRLETEEFAPEDAAPEQTIFGQRMLARAYAYHAQRQAGVNDPAKFPILVIAPTLDYSSRPEAEMALDTFELKLKIGDSEYMLPRWSDGHGEREQWLWLKHVVPYLYDTENDLRFYKREQIYGEGT